MKKFLLTTVLSTLVFGAGAAQAQTGGNLSASVLGGWAWHPDLHINNGRQSVDDGFNLGARLSYKMTEPGESGLSLDADYLYNRSNYAAVSGTHLASSSFMGDIVYHLHTASPWSLYGGGG